MSKRVANGAEFASLNAAQHQREAGDLLGEQATKVQDDGLVGRKVSRRQDAAGTGLYCRYPDVLHRRRQARPPHSRAGLCKPMRLHSEPRSMSVMGMLRQPSLSMTAHVLCFH